MCAVYILLRYENVHEVKLTSEQKGVLGERKRRTSADGSRGELEENSHGEYCVIQMTRKLLFIMNTFSMNEPSWQNIIQTIFICYFSFFFAYAFIEAHLDVRKKHSSALCRCRSQKTQLFLNK